MKKDIIQKQTDIDSDALSNLILKKEPEIIQKYPTTGFNGEYTDGQTELGPNSLTSRFYHFNVLDWKDTDLVKEIIRSGYEAYTGVKDTPIYVKCWANVMRKGDQIAVHSHGKDPYGYISGHVCVQVTDTNTNYYNPYGGDPWSSPNKAGKITLFPSWVSHGTDKVVDSQERITIAFDILTEDGYNKIVKDDMKEHWVKV